MSAGPDDRILIVGDVDTRGHARALAAELARRGFAACVTGPDVVHGVDPGSPDGDLAAIVEATRAADGALVIEGLGFGPDLAAAHDALVLRDLIRHAPPVPFHLAHPEPPMTKLTPMQQTLAMEHDLPLPPAPKLRSKRDRAKAKAARKARKKNRR